MGSTPHAISPKVERPQDQGVIAMMGVFIDTFVISDADGSGHLSSGALASGRKEPLAQLAFNQTFGSFGNIFIAICMLFFAFSTIIGWYFFTARST